MMQKISVALAVFNEEDNLRNCLESVKAFAWEIIIVDGGSTDKTLDVAKKFGAKVILANNPIVFHINKNIAIDAAIGDWILQLDADEIVTDELRKEIIEKILEWQKNIFKNAWILLLMIIPLNGQGILC